MSLSCLSTLSHRHRHREQQSYTTQDQRSWHHVATSPPVHCQMDKDVRRDFYSSGYEEVDVVVSTQCRSVQRESVINQTAHAPAKQLRDVTIGWRHMPLHVPHYASQSNVGLKQRHHWSSAFVALYTEILPVTIPWWRHQMVTFSAFLALCAGNSPVTGEFPYQRPVTRCFDVFFDLAWTNGWVNIWGAGELRRHRGYYDVIVMVTRGCPFKAARTAERVYTTWSHHKLVNTKK